MRLWPSGLGGRLAVALAGAVAAVVVLDALVRRYEPPPRAVRRGAAPDASVPLEPVVRSWSAALGASLQPVTGRIALARRIASLAPDVAPVVELLPDGDLAVRRPRPLATAPAPLPRRSREGFGAAVVVPTADLRELSPAARGALVAALRAWIEERPVDPERLVAVDFELPMEVLDRLLAWLP